MAYGDKKLIRHAEKYNIVDNKKAKIGIVQIVEPIVPEKELVHFKEADYIGKGTAPIDPLYIDTGIVQSFKGEQLELKSGDIIFALMESGATNATYTLRSFIDMGGVMYPHPAKTDMTPKEWSKMEQMLLKAKARHTKRMK